MANMFGRQVVLLLMNKSGGSVVKGDVVVLDTGNNTAFTTTTSGQSQISLGIAQETIASNATGRVLTAGYADLINVPASVTRGHYMETHTVAKQATGNSSRRAGSFGQFLTGGTTPTGLLWGFPDNAGASGETVATSSLFDAKGDLAAGTADNTAARLAVGANGAVLQADSSQSTGLKWVQGIGTVQTYTPTWGSDGSAPTVGNATVAGRYYLLGPNLIYLWIYFARGSTSANGTGSYNFTLPGSYQWHTSAGGPAALSAVINDSGTARFAASGLIVTGARTKVYVVVGDATSDRLWTGTNPMTLATGDECTIQGVLEVI